MKEFHESNGYRLVYNPTHSRAHKSGGHVGYVYEHILIAEQSIGRSLTTGEVVHHLNKKRNDNRPANLLVLENSQHTKLHHWLDQQIIIPNPLKRNEPILCKICQTPINHGNKQFCSLECSNLSHRKVKRPSKEQLIEDVINLPMTAVGKKYNVSDNAIRKWLKTLSLPITRSAYQ